MELINTQQLVNFLVRREWTHQENGDYFQLKPPNSLQLPRDYSLFVRKEIANADKESYLSRLLRNLSDIYKIEIDELARMVSKASTILSLRVYDDHKNNIGLTVFEQLLSSFSRLLEDTAAFTLTKKPKLDEDIHEAKDYLSKCNFFKTAEGSFVAKIELPSDGVLRQQGLFDVQVNNNEVNVILEKTLALVESKISKSTEDEDFRNLVLENRNLINLDVLEDIKEIYEVTGIQNMDYSFNFPERRSTVRMEGFDTNRIKNLSAFIGLIREELEDKVYDITLNNGVVYGLSSKDPFEDKNKIRVYGVEKGLNQPITVVIKLDSEQYIQAIEAHKDKKNIFIKGKAVKRKREYHIIELEKFHLGEEAEQ